MSYKHHMSLLLVQMFRIIPSKFKTRGNCHTSAKRQCAARELSLNRIDSFSEYRTEAIVVETPIESCSYNFTWVDCKDRQNLKKWIIKNNINGNKMASIELKSQNTEITVRR